MHLPRDRSRELCVFAEVCCIFTCMNFTRATITCIAPFLFPHQPSNSMEFYPLLFAAFHFMLLMFPSTSVIHSNFTDLSALLAFRARVGDPHNILTTNWTADVSFCTWTGVSCSHRRQRVVSLRFDDIPLYGTIAPEVANMSFLSYLILQNTSLVGPIPASLSQLPRLKVLALSANQLSGTIPPAIFNLSMLAHLYLPANNLSGDIPSNFSFHSMLPRIQELILPGNQLSGNIPSSLFNCHHIQQLSLADNQFTGSIPMEIGNLEQLTYLYLGGNRLTGSIPASLGNLTNLFDLDLSENNLSGVISEELGGLSNLKLLNLHASGGVTGPIPISLSNVSSLIIIDMSVIKLTGPILVDFGNLRQLRTLLLNSNRLSGGLEFLGSLSNCKDLRYLQLGSNELEGHLPNTIGNLTTNLVNLVLDENYFMGNIPDELGNLSSLTTLDLGNNELAGTIPPKIVMLERLQVLYLRNNKIHGPIPHEIGRLQILIQLFLDGNILSGPIPESLGNISSLEKLTMSSNELSSRIPQNIWSLTRLLELNLSRNFLNGSLALGVGNIKFLYFLDISLNQLSGEIPRSLKALQMLAVLDLSNNSFSGTIPQSLGEIINLEVLDLSCNNLSGAIPDSLSNLRHLTGMNLSFNSLEGEIPNKGAFLNLSITFLVGNVALCGAPSLGFQPCTKNQRTRVHLLEYILPPVFVTIFLIACFYFLLRLRRKQTKGPAVSTPFPDDFRLISYHELVRATENFCEANLLGRGSFGSVYKGVLDDGLLTAIKVFNLEVDGASRSFDIECGALRMVRHRNLVKILSTCSNLDFRALILQFIPNGSLERWLYSHNYCLNQLQRINIVIDVASALEYLHHHHSQVVLHCDLKPSNILLDEDMTAHVSDFGIAKLLVGDSMSLTSASSLGTIGYMAPEYASIGRASRKGDVYSFGILLLEIFTRKNPSDPMFVGESSLRNWVFESYLTAPLDIVDRNLLKDGYGNESASKDLNLMNACLSSIMELGIICSSDSPNERPTMIDVVSKLQKHKVDCLAVSPIA